ncbi:hypothetical protein FSP39_004461 [Pinctada imbricata]|uniref:TTI1 N-terminal TPR domain-containing protein n=1 Tax=Pinctada imbricata TaxID=66713 RepID=A0AA88YG95_PINIB|nr:hypothetical protein FSP39_004461 [Pinctada imbricata]
MASCERRVAFETLRPLCVQLTREHTRKNVTAVSIALDKVNNRIILQELQEYLIFPVRILLKTQKDYSEDLYTDAFSLLEKILRETRIGSWDLFMDLFTTACVMIGSPSPTKDHGKVCSEELKFAIVKTLNLMVNRCDYAILQKLFSLQSLPMLGHAISIMLNLAENERARHLKIAAMNGIVGLSQVDGEYCSKVKAMLGDTFASFLPGISITLIRVITGDSKQGHSVLITAISTLMKVVHLVMNTEWIEESQTRRKLFPSPINSCSDDKLKSLAVVRDETWVKATDEKLAVLVKQITKVRGHSSWKVRTALLDFAGTLVEHMKSLPSCLPHLLEIMVGLLTDEYPNIAMASSRYLEVFSRSHMTTECRPLVEMLEENLHNLSMTLPRQMRSVDEDQKYSAVSLLSGYISLLGPHLHSVLRTSCHLRRLSLALVQILELDCTDISMIQERTTSVGHGSELISINGSKDVLKPRKNFKHFHDRRIHLELQKVCRLLGFYGDITLLIDHFLDIFHETILHKMQATLLINELILGAAGIGGL